MAAQDTENVGIPSVAENPAGFQDWVQTKAMGVIKSGSKATLDKMFGFVKQVGSSIGEGMSLTKEGWDSLSPSSKAAMLGTAATLWARNKGYHNTAGDIAKGTAQLYTNLSGQESQERIAGARDKAALASAAAKAQPSLADVDRRAKMYAPTQEEIEAMATDPAFQDQYKEAVGNTFRDATPEQLRSGIHRMAAIHRQYVLRHLQSGKGGQPVPFRDFFNMTDEQRAGL
jgi:hypothetical protein